jgi:hypothetical protein
MRHGGAVTLRERPHYVALLAEACRKEGQTEEGVAMVSEELARVHDTGER